VIAGSSHRCGCAHRAVATSRCSTASQDCSKALDELVYPRPGAIPMSKLRWTSKSSTKLADELVRQGFEVSSRSVLRLFAQNSATPSRPTPRSLKSPAPDRDAQFNHLNDTASAFIDDGQTSHFR